MTVLVDANILLDVLAARHPFHESAAAVWDLAKSRRIDAVVSAISFSNIYYIARKTFGREKAMDAVHLIARDFRVAPVDESVIAEAIGSALPDFEDAIQIFSGKKAGATHVVTRDAGGFRSGTLAVMTAVQLVATFALKE